ncbi:hypothetical protein QMK19_39860 [Streptomyces sp. H10-C2]|uniref:hypothetical protein n=1 Tax=unclassified Streptomyces TaxID=2593676 RepID=UPI0024BA33DA|nr:MULTISPECIES: hypothetical protein [unclassified Streptomyces]MDJ0347056.1 hypothetical protein [Streptomyces sp. PH10-H1]MDJ0375580.1 hypothetical protein [Streptomyces sp. H10-C2]
MRPDYSAPIPETDICDACARRLTDGCHLDVIPDSSALHSRDPARDGRRLVVACSPEHLAALQDEYRTRPFTAEELWAGQVDRALAGQRRLTQQELSEVTRLTALQIQRARAWKEQQQRRPYGPNQQTPETG